MTSAERIAFLSRRLVNWPAAPAAKPPRELARRQPFRFGRVGGMRK